MSDRILTYQLGAFAGEEAASAQVYFPDYMAAKPAIPLNIPYRSDYYKISLCLQGTAELQANQETYLITAGCLILATPAVVKQWLHISQEYESLSVFFTQNFITDSHAATGSLGYLLRPPTTVLPLAPADVAALAATLRFLQQKYKAASSQRANILQSLLISLLFEIGALYQGRPGPYPANKHRGGMLAEAFQQLVQAHCVSARSVGFYADVLCVTPNHLNQVIKGATGKTASALIANAAMLKAKALLRNQALPINQIAASLHFTDQFAFSRFFKKNAGLSPSAYRQAA